MKRFAAHYLFLPSIGFIKQYVVEIIEGGSVQHIFPLTEEIESIEWMPGVIALLSTNEIKNIGMIFTNISMFKSNLPNVSNQSSQCFLKAFEESLHKSKTLYPCLFYPFDFISMQPVAETRHKLLQ